MQLNNKTYNFLLSFLLCISGAVMGQTAKEDLIALGKKMNSLTSYQMNVEVKVYKNDFDLKPSFVSKGRTARQETNFYVSMLNRSTIVNENLLLIVDNQQKLIMHSPIDKGQLKEMINSQIINIDSIIKNQ